MIDKNIFIIDEKIGKNEKGKRIYKLSVSLIYVAQKSGFYEIR